MKLNLLKSNERGHANHGWLDTYHSFSFANYYNPRRMGFRSLRVINQDIIGAGEGFPTHPHSDMEIFSYILRGSLAHQDSLGNGRVLQPGQIQLMSAGRGVTHSEFNPSNTEGASLLQIWIQPRERGLEPSYTEWHADPSKEGENKVLVISPDGRDGSATIHQDAFIYRARLAKGQSVTHQLAKGRGVWFQLIKGTVMAHGHPLQPGDAFSVEEAGEVRLQATEDAEGLLFDLI
jgi:quercetin 2,3-dioxygenase